MIHQNPLFSERNQFNVLFRITLDINNRIFLTIAIIRTISMFPPSYLTQTKQTNGRKQVWKQSFSILDQSCVSKSFRAELPVLLYLMGANLALSKLQPLCCLRQLKYMENCIFWTLKYFQRTRTVQSSKSRSFFLSL